MISTLPKELVEAAHELLLKEDLNKWLGKSVLKHDDGTPMHFYHGTNHDINKFSHDFVGKGTDSYGPGFYFTNNPEVASNYPIDKKEGAHNVMKVHIRLEKPIDPEDEKPLRRDHIQKMIMAAPNHKESLMNYGDVSYSGYQKVLNSAVDTYTELPKYNAMHALHNDFYDGHSGEFLTNFTKITKHDGVMVNNGDTKIVNVFTPNQVKSAIGNKGSYSKKSDVITEQATTHIQNEGWMHIENRKPLTPLEHVNDVVSNHKQLGWHVEDDEAIVLQRPLMMNRGGMGCLRSIKMKHEDGRTAILHLKFRHGNTIKQREYMVNREFRTHVD